MVNCTTCKFRKSKKFPNRCICQKQSKCKWIPKKDSGSLKKAYCSFKTATTTINKKLKKTKYYKTVYEHLKTIGYTVTKQLGKEGKDGYVIEVKNQNNKLFAVKIFKKGKSIQNIKNEYNLQDKSAKLGVSPKVYGIHLNKNYKYFIMDKLDITYNEYLKKKKIKKKDIEDIFKHFVTLSKNKINVNDPNVFLNVMKKGKKWYIIDFGFAKITKKKFQGMTIVPKIINSIKNPELKKYGKQLIKKFETKNKLRIDKREFVANSVKRKKNLKLLTMNISESRRQSILNNIKLLDNYFKFPII